MSGIRDIAKGGWHPKGKDGKSTESWRGDFKGVNQVAGWLGKGKNDSTSNAQDHVSRPLSTLKDPALFGPPPKHYGGAALSSQTTTGLGAPLSREEIQAKQRAEEEKAQTEADGAAKPKPPSVPYRADTTGLSTSHLPPPPGRKDGSGIQQPMTTAKSKPPSLPPRLPPRQNSQPVPALPSNSSQADPHRGILNQGSLSRLGAAGISVPGFGIGPREETTSPPPAPATSSVSSSHLDEIQARFSRLSPSSSKPGTSTEGTTFAEKQAALKTASSFRKDPSSVSFSDAKSAASTANNFRERHGEQVKSGWQSANKLNAKYGIADRVGSFGATSQSESTASASQPIEAVGPTEPGSFSGKKKPPPPPVKKANLASLGAPKEVGPPPLPLSSKPKPQVNISYQ